MAVFAAPPVIVGHRGLGKGTVAGHDENTATSFLHAVECGVTWVEVDVRRTRDDTLVVVHDPTYPDGAFVADVDTGEARRRGSLLLNDLLDLLPDGVGVDLDLKPCTEDATRDRTSTTAALLAPTAVRASRRRPVVVTSLDPASLTVLADLAPGVDRGLLTWIEFPADQAIAAAAHFGVQVAALHHGSLRPNRYTPAQHLRSPEYLIGRAHAAGIDVLVWCPEPPQARELIAAGVDALCVNDVPRAVSRLTQQVSREGE